MLDVAPSELLIVAVVALVVIGPKDLPKALRVLGYWVGRARGVASQFRSGFDNMVREAELAEMETKWAAENQRILAEHPATTPVQSDAAGEDGAAEVPLMVEQPAIEPGETASGDPVSPPIAVDAKPGA